MDQQLMKTVMWISLFVGQAIAIAIYAVICWLLHQILARIPREHRKQDPPMVWLLVIPYFAGLWCFFVYPRIADSFESYFRSKGRTENTGHGLAWTYCVLFALLTAVSMYQLVTLPLWRDEPLPTGLDPVALGAGCFSFVVLLVWVLLLVKFWGLRGKIEEPPG